MIKNYLVNSVEFPTRLFLFAIFSPTLSNHTQINSKHKKEHYKMKDKITRRDFINGTLMATGAFIVPFGCTTVINKLNPLYYPPALTGLRGSHAGSNTHAHSRAWNKKSDWGTTTKLKEEYDLIVVGGGISGLSAAYFFQQQHGKDKKVLILNNHDDFGGHAKRNEHTIDGKLRLGHGGSQSIEEAKDLSNVVRTLFKDLGIELERFNTAYDKDFYKRNNLGAVTYFNKETFGEDKVVKHPYCNYPNYIEGIIMEGKLSNKDAVEQAPLSAKGKEQLLRVLNGGLHEIDVPKTELEDYIRSHSYFDYLKNNLGVDDPGVLRMARHSAIDWWHTGTDLMSIETAKSCSALGFTPKAIYNKEDPNIYHFPDGNASIARALVKKMIPDVAEGNSMEDLVLSKFKYAELDKSKNAARIRLNSTVVNVQHDGDPIDSNEVLVDYVNNNKLYQVKGKNVVMACYNMMIPHIVHSGSSKKTRSSFETSIEKSVNLHHCRPKKLEGNQRNGNWNGHVARKYAPSGIYGLSGKYRWL